MTLRAVVRWLIILVVTLLVQTTLALDVRIGGAVPELMFLLPIAAGIVAGPVEGAVVGFVAGLAADLFLPTPFGLTALVGTLVGAAVGAATGSLVREFWWFSSGVALVASAGAVMLYAVLGAVLGQDQFLHVDLAPALTVVAVADAVLAPLAVRLARWALTPAFDRQVVQR